MTVLDYPIGSLVSQEVYDGKKRYGVVYKAADFIDSKDIILWILWQLSVPSHTVANLSYTEPTLLGPNSAHKPIEVVALPKGDADQC